MIVTLFRAFISVVIGFAAIQGLVVIADAVVGSLSHASIPAVMITNLVAAFPFAVVGGFIAASIARGSEMWAAWGVVAVSVTLSVVALIGNPAHPPIWYWSILLVLLIAGTLTGATLRARTPRKLVV